MGERSIAPNRAVVATLQFAGTDRGTTRDETRQITGLVVTNNMARAIGVEVESEESKLAFSDVIEAGETKVVQTRPIDVKWNPDRLGGFWDGVNIRWRIPARG